MTKSSESFLFYPMFMFCGGRETVRMEGRAILKGKTI